jgi:hypothetical protein
MASKTDSSSHWPTRLTQLAFGLSLALLIARATFLESIRDPEIVAPGSPPVPHGAGPAASLVLDWLMCLPMLLVILRRIVDRNYDIRSKLSHALFAAIAIWAAISATWASDKFSAVIEASQFIAAAALMWAMTQLVRSWLDLRLVAGACFGILLIYIAQGAIYRLVDVPDNIKYWEQNRQQELRDRGWEPGSFPAEQFEKRLTAGEMMGFNSSPNSFAAMIVILGIISAGVAIQRIRDRDEPAWPTAIILALLAATWILYYTYSRTALITPILAAGALIIFPQLARWRKQVYVICIATILVDTALLIGHGLYHGSLLHSSLTFRWRYWVGAARIFMKHPIVGVGWGSFGAHYLAVRLPIAAEEIKDPHNFIVRAFVELGIVGGALMLAWLARVWWELTPPTSPLEKPQKFGPRTIFSISALAILINIFASIDFSLTSTGSQWFTLLELLKRLLFLFLLLLGFAVIVLKSSHHPAPDDRPAPWLLLSIITAIAIFLLHNMIDFSLFEPGPMCMFAALIGAALGAKSRAARNHSIAISISAFCALIIFLIGSAIVIVAPIVIAESFAQRGDDDIRNGQLSAGADELRKAFEQSWIPNADYAFRSANAMQQIIPPSPQAQEMLDAAAQADPMSIRTLLSRAAYRFSQPHPDASAVISDFETALALDPNEVSIHQQFADALERFGQPQRAIAELESALHYNSLLSPDEPKRLSAQELAKIQQRINGINHR